jgi:hypothetical protein
MAHLIVPHRNGPGNDAEFRYSLRSIEVNLHDPVPHNLVVVGDCPDWLVPDVHLPASDPQPPNTGKVAEIRNFVLAACRELRGEPQALYLDDDYFLLEPTEAVLPLYWGPLEDHRSMIIRRHSPEFWLAVAHTATIDYLPGRPQSWELHRPLPINPSDALTVLPSNDEPLLWRSLYGNLAVPVRRAYRGGDGKLGNGRIPLGATWLSSSFNTWQRSLKQALVEALPEPSRWEKS